VELLNIGALKNRGIIGPWFVIMAGSLLGILFVVHPGLDVIRFLSPGLVLVQVRVLEHSTVSKLIPAHGTSIHFFFSKKKREIPHPESDSSYLQVVGSTGYFLTPMMHRVFSQSLQCRRIKRCRPKNNDSEQCAALAELTY